MSQQVKIQLQVVNQPQDRDRDRDRDKDKGKDTSVIGDRTQAEYNKSCQVMQLKADIGFRLALTPDQFGTNYI